MAEAIRMPLLSDTMTEGVIAAWHKKVGDPVKSDEAIADVETDKATMEVMPYVDGTLLYIGVEVGKAAKVNEIIAIIGKAGEDYQSLLENNPTPAPAPKATAEEAIPAPTAAPASEPAPAAPEAKKPAPTDATVIRMPLLSDTMTEGKIVAWHKKVGDTVKSDDVLADVETDKATMEVMPYVDGTLLHIGVPEGEAAKVNDIIAIVGKEGTDVSALLTDSGQAASAMAPAPEQTSAPATTTEVSTEDEPAQHGERVFASPLARRMAEEKGIDLHEIKGTGDHGRIIRRDIEQYQPAARAATPAPAVTTTLTPAPAKTTSAPVFTPAVSGEEAYTDTPLSQMRKVIAQRLSESKNSAPHFYLRITVTMDKAMEARKAMNDLSPTKISFNDLIIKASAMALRKHPDVNSSWLGDKIRHNHHINVGTAVAIDDGLIVPVIKFADQKSLSQIAEEAGVLIDKARNKKLQPPEFTGNTFTISNLGMMDIDEFTAIINPPDACILAVGKIAATPVVENGQVVVRQLLKLTLSCDHRVVDGAVGARFLQTLKAYLENPVTMLV